MNEVLVWPGEVDDDVRRAIREHTPRGKWICWLCGKENVGEVCMGMVAETVPCGYTRESSFWRGEWDRLGLGWGKYFLGDCVRGVMAEWERQLGTSVEDWR